MLFDTTLRQFAGYLLTDYPDVISPADVGREQVEGYKTWLAQRSGYRGKPGLSKITLGMRMGHLRSFSTRIIEWNYQDVPARAAASCSG